MKINTEKMKPIELIEDENSGDKLSLFSLKENAVGFLSEEGDRDGGCKSANFAQG